MESAPIRNCHLEGRQTDQTQKHPTINTHKQRISNFHVSIYWKKANNLIIPHKKKKKKVRPVQSAPYKSIVLTISRFEVISWSESELPPDIAAAHLRSLEGMSLPFTYLYGQRQNQNLHIQKRNPSPKFQRPGINLLFHQAFPGTAEAYSSDRALTSSYNFRSSLSGRASQPSPQSDTFRCTHITIIPDH